LNCLNGLNCLNNKLVMAPGGNPDESVVRNMFDRIAGRYDLLNRVISFRLDSRWRKEVIKALARGGNQIILDLGSGTGDLTFAAVRYLENVKAIGLDFSMAMLRHAEAKQGRATERAPAFFVQGSALQLPFRDNAFDGVVTAFVLRNISDLQVFFVNSFRTLKPGGRLVSIDMFPPKRGIFGAFYSLYFYRVVPWIGAMLANDRSAYTYLSESVRRFDPPEKVAEMIRQAGFRTVEVRRFLRGAVCMHIADKP
jgi:demethylmenaquinone methyltransferase / 2-methoxy-6-polyprenyl-1,4-benzoquinol methylase